MEHRRERSQEITGAAATGHCEGRKDKDLPCQPAGVALPALGSEDGSPEPSRFDSLRPTSHIPSFFLPLLASRAGPAF